MKIYIRKFQPYFQIAAAFSLGILLGIYLLKFFHDRGVKKAIADAAVLQAEAEQRRFEHAQDSIANACYIGLALHDDKICRAVYYRALSYDTVFYRPQTTMPQNFDEALVYGKFFTPLKEVEEWCLQHGQTTFARYVDRHGTACVYYHYVRKGERFRIYQPLDHDTLYWKTDEGPTEGWAKIWANDAYWEKGELHVRDNLSVGFAYAVAPPDDN
jgi:hypothetical protein